VDPGRNEKLATSQKALISFCWTFQNVAESEY
jgi:hypothetical protein